MGSPPRSPGGQGQAEGLGPAFAAAPRPYLSPARGGEEDAAAEGRQEEFERRHLRAARLSGSGAGSRAGPGRAGAAAAPSPVPPGENGPVGSRGGRSSAAPGNRQNASAALLSPASPCFSACSSIHERKGIMKCSLEHYVFPHHCKEHSFKLKQWNFRMEEL